MCRAWRAPPEVPWSEHQYVRTIQGRKQVRRVALASAGDLTSWDSFVDAARGHGAPDATLWACLIREVAPTSQPVEEAGAPVSTRAWADGRAALHAYRPRWHIENDGYRELQAGWGLEEQHWGRDATALRGRLTLTCLACTTAQVYRSRAGERLATVAIRRLRQQHRAALGAAPAVLYVEGCYAVLALEELLAALGTPVRESLLPAVATGDELRPPQPRLSPNICVLREYMAYFNGARPHQGLRQRIPDGTEEPVVQREIRRKIRVIPVLGGLHHTYQRAA